MHFLFLLYDHDSVLILTSCRLISFVENIPFWWTSCVSDHSALFLLLGGVGAAALLQGLWGALGDLPSPRKEAWRWGKRSSQMTKSQARQSREEAWPPVPWGRHGGAYLDGLAEAPHGPILHRRDEVG